MCTCVPRVPVVLPTPMELCIELKIVNLALLPSKKTSFDTLDTYVPSEKLIFIVFFNLTFLNIN